MAENFWNNIAQEKRNNILSRLAQQESVSLGELCFSTPIFNALMRSKIQSINSLLSLSPEQIREIPRIGPGKCNEILETISALNADLSTWSSGSGTPSGADKQVPEEQRRSVLEAIDALPDEYAKILKHLLSGGIALDLCEAPGGADRGNVKRKIGNATRMLFASGEQFQEDYYASLLKKNNIDPKDFFARTGTPDWIYHYLKFRNKTGIGFQNTDAAQADFPEDIQVSLEKYLEEIELAKSKELGIDSKTSPFPTPAELAAEPDVDLSEEECDKLLKRVEAEFETAELLGNIEISETELKVLAAYGRIFYNRNLVKKPYFIDSPVLAVYLVQVKSRNFESRAYWPLFAPDWPGIEKLRQQSIVCQSFMRTMKDHGKQISDGDEGLTAISAQTGKVKKYKEKSANLSSATKNTEK